MKKLISMMLVLTMSAAIVIPAAAAEDFGETDLSGAVGYYYSDDTGIMITSNGSVYTIDTDTLETTDKSSDVSIVIDGDNFVIDEGDSAIYFERQTEKGRTEDGEAYYAMYSDYLGTAEDVPYTEGHNIQVGDYIFGCTYDVVMRKPEGRFFDFDDVSTVDTKKKDFEGSGYDTPEEAVLAYLEAYENTDLDAMLSTFAIESYADNYDILAYINRIGSISEYAYFITTDGDIAGSLNIYDRMSDIISEIEYSYFKLTGSMAYNDGVIRTVKLDDMEEEYGSVSDFLNVYYAPDESVFEGMETGPTLSHEDFCTIFEKVTEREYDSENVSEVMAKSRVYYGAEDYCIVPQVFYVNGTAYLICMETACYDGRWYNLNASYNVVTMYFDETQYCGGIMPLDELGDFDSILKKY